MGIERVELHRELPLGAPFALHVYPVYGCNFKCVYCIHSMPAEKRAALGFKNGVMPFDVCRKAIDDAAAFGTRIKALIFAGHGEPLLHKDICRMVGCAKQSGAFDRVEVVTNASLLDRNMADGLIEAGLDRLKISIQGTGAAKYESVSGVSLDYEAFLANIEYLYKNKKHTEIYVKIIDVALDGKKDEALFRKQFSPIADAVDVEYAIPFVPGLDHGEYSKEFAHCKQGHWKSSEICSMPFYTLVVTPEGDILPCCSLDVPAVLGNIGDMSLKDVWEGGALRRFQRLQLVDRTRNPACRDCSVPRYGLQQGDYLDDRRDDLLRVYTE